MRTPSSLASSLLVLVACHAAPGAVPAPGAPNTDDPASLYDSAAELVRRGDRDGALAVLERLDARGWSFCPADRDMSGLVDLPRYRALCARMKARAPRILRATVARTLADPELAMPGSCRSCRPAPFAIPTALRATARVSSSLISAGSRS